MQQTFVLFHQKRIQDRQKRDLIVEAFRRADKNKDGQLSVDEILSIYSEHGIENVSRDDIQRLVDEADKDGTGELSEKEFINSSKASSGVMEAQEGKSPNEDENQNTSQQNAHHHHHRQGKKAELAFRLFDKDKDGFITKNEMEKLSKSLTKEQINKVFARFDKDGDGRLSYAEFRKMMNQ
ncbi:uncharacterized protein [Lepeophtheirus salmonis]|nr:calmodulin-like isoform X2 [Lepeophtheirus salmonis]